MIKQTEQRLRPVLAFVAAVIPTMVSYVLLDPGSGLLYLFIFMAAAVGLSWGRAVTSKAVSRILLIIQTIFYLFGFTVIVISLNLTPASAYLAWFRIAQADGSSGMLSYMFTVKICFFSSVFAGTIIRHGYERPLAGMTAMALIIFYAVFQTPVLGYMAGFFILVSAILMVIRGPRKFKSRNIRVLVTFSILAALVAVPLSLIKPKPSNPIIDTLDQGGVSKAVVKVYPNFPFLYNMPGYGHQLGSRDIGDRPSLTARPVFQVSGDPGQTIYLRTAVFDFYTGSGWAYNENKIAEAEFTYGTMFKTDAGDSFNDALEVEVLIDFFSSVPHTVDTKAILMNKGRLPELAYGSVDTGYLFDIPVTKGTRFLLREEPPVADIDGPGDALFQLPSNIPTDAISLAQRLGESGDPTDTAKNIKDYLTYNYYYTLEPSRDRQFDDPAWEFLLAAGEGYCVHFATSFVLLARMNNIPARYVTGFLVNIPRDSDSATVTGFSSHAWAEIWVPGTGWMVQEATPPMLPEFYDDPSFYEMYNPFGSRYTEMQLESIMGARVARRAEEEDEKKRLQIPAAPVALAVIIAGLLLAMYYLTFHSIYTFGSPKRKIRIIARKMITRGRSEGIESPEVSGWVAWSDQLADNHPDESKFLARAVGLIQAGFFGGKARKLREVSFIRRTYRKVFGRHLTNSRRAKR